MLDIDLHIHSINSGHAYGTFYDIVAEAKKKNMKMIAITDHGPKMAGTISYIHFYMGHRKPEIEGLKVLWGCEANVLDKDGNIDLDEKALSKLDLVILGFHKHCGYEDLGIEGNTKAINKALDNPKIKILAHPTNHQFECDFEAVANHAIDNDVLLELNLAYLKIKGEVCFDKFKKMVEIVKSRNKKLIISSDAHFIHEIGDDSILAEYKDKLGLTDDIIINNYPDELMEFLVLKKK